MMTNVSFALSTLWLILTSAIQEDAWGQSKNRYLAKRREVSAWGMGQNIEGEAGVLWPPTTVLVVLSMQQWGSTPYWVLEPLGECSIGTTHSFRAQAFVPLIPVSPL